MAEYIKREALDKALTIAAANDKDENRRTWAKAICILHDATAVDAVLVVHGRWIPRKGKWFAYFQCSVCGEKISYLSADGKALTNYCPNCGAKMDG